MKEDTYAMTGSRADGEHSAAVDGAVWQRLPLGLFAIAAATAGVLLGGWWIVLPLMCALSCSSIWRQRGSLLRPRRTAESGLSAANVETEVLKAAKRHSGHVNAVIVAAETGVGLERAEAILTTMAKKGFALMEVSDAGRLWYDFPGLAIPRTDHTQTS